MLGMYAGVIGVSLLLIGVFSQLGEKSLLEKFHQNDYHLEYGRCELVRYNKKYSNYAEIRTFKFNRTATGVNVTFNIKVDLGTDALVAGQVYKFMSNEYRFFPIHIQVHICDLFKNNLMGFAGYTKCGNFTGCPLNKGTYRICNFVFDEARFPPLIPSGQYMIEFKGLHSGNEMFVVRSYGGVVHPEV